MRKTSPISLSPEHAAVVFQDLDITAETFRAEAQTDRQAWGVLTQDLLTPVPDFVDLPVNREAAAAFRRWFARARPGNLANFPLIPAHVVCFVKVSDATPSVWYFRGFAQPEKLSIEEVARRLTAVTSITTEPSLWDEF